MRRYLKVRLFVIILTTLIQNNCIASESPKIIFYTANEYPYQLDTGSGATFEIIKAIYKSSNQHLPKIIFSSWSDSYNTVKSTKNTAIFTISRRKEREKFFDWCCRLYEAPIKGVLTIRGAGIKKQADLKSKIGAVIKNDTSEFIINSLIKKDKTIKKYLVNNFTEAIKLILKGKIDFIVAKEPLLLDTCFKEHLNCRGFIHIKTNLVIPNNNIYIAFNPLSDKHLKHNFLNMFNKFKKSPRYNMIIKKYGMDKKGGE